MAEKLSEEEREAFWILDRREIERTIVEADAYYLEWLREQHGTYSILVKTQEAAVAAGRRAMEDHDG